MFSFVQAQSGKESAARSGGGMRENARDPSRTPNISVTDRKEFCGGRALRLRPQSVLPQFVAQQVPFDPEGPAGGGQIAVVLAHGAGNQVTLDSGEHASEVQIC
jgi:hypothetical protein